MPEAIPQPIALLRGPYRDFFESEASIFFQCQTCGGKITDHKTANVIIPWGEEGQTSQFFVVHKDRACDPGGKTSWMDLEDFVRALAESVGLKLMDKPSRN
ncbi:MAG: hypothetical protein JO170_14500 [Verrucomicrobia bacterium]|nr:hypothetical protein [Verrucomicrobiota bacterium]